MLIIAKEETLELARLEKLLHQLNQPYWVLLTNLETDLEKPGNFLYPARSSIENRRALIFQ